MSGTLSHQSPQELVQLQFRKITSLRDKNRFARPTPPCRYATDSCSRASLRLQHPGVNSHQLDTVKDELIQELKCSHNSAKMISSFEPTVSPFRLWHNLKSASFKLVTCTTTLTVIFLCQSIERKLHLTLDVSCFRCVM